MKKMKSMIAAGAHMPEGGKRSVPKGQFSNGGLGTEGYIKPKFGIHDKGMTHAKATHPSAPAKPKGNVPHHSETKHPGSHAAFHALGAPKNGKY